MYWSIPIQRNILASASLLLRLLALPALEKQQHWRVWVGFMEVICTSKCQIPAIIAYMQDTLKPITVTGLCNICINLTKSLKTSTMSGYRNTKVALPAGMRRSTAVS